ncbi:RNA polymerase sigma-70 factor (ECF subfamily) [Fontibacillus phaseoli]|uniref:RNA polymerase sigma-70 factor (ECF subfamily) n=1 Tax=Fontibacillus phaseoli TaxID=1416533 RepID=A0A369BMD9_9BACL|nr:RNA polymerase sigma factor [Fontibacillus phaseoli]RCX22561.1 RNA polymerase sigma-70 factor (ECF subfamily) [Fontibacillus phaseoli]
MDNPALGPRDDEFAEIYRMHVDTVYRLCFILLKNTADADDAVQSIFLKMFKHNKTFNDHEHEKAWLIVATKNHCKDVLKSWWRSRRIDMDVLPEKTSWENDKQQGEVLAKLLSLPEKYRTVLYLYYYEEYSVREISKLLDRKESTIQTQLSKGRERLKADLRGGECFEREPSKGTI